MPKTGSTPIAQVRRRSTARSIARLVDRRSLAAAVVWGHAGDSAAAEHRDS
jgi:hypothetical protein